MRQYNRERVVKSVDNPLESGIIKENNKKPITKITDNAIDKLVGRPHRELSEDERKENQDIL